MLDKNEFHIPRYGMPLGPSCLSITCCRLPTYLQVVVYYETNTQKLIAEKKRTKYKCSLKPKLLKLFEKK